MVYWFTITTDGSVGKGSASHAPDETTLTPPGGQFLGPFDTLTTAQQAVWEAPSAYLYLKDAFVLQPSLTASLASSTLTVTLTNPPTTPPTSATVTVAGTAIPVPLSSNTGSVSFTIDGNLAGVSIPAQVSATGCVGCAVELGTAGGTAVAVQAISPNTATYNPSTTDWRIATTSKAHLIRHYLSESGDLDLLYRIAALHVIPALHHSTYAPITLDSKESQALSDLQHAVANTPNLT